MAEEEKVNFYNLHKSMIHPKIKSDLRTKPLWRRTFWSTAKDSDIYKASCVDIFINHFPELYKKLKNERRIT